MIDLVPMMIELSQGQVAIVDISDYEEFLRRKWYANWNPGTQSFYAVRNYTKPNGKQGKLPMHREILELEPESKMRVDHINHDTLDNRRSNLRIATVSQNRQNKKKHRNNTSGVTGVFWHVQAQKWWAQIYVDGERIPLGLYNKFEGACKARWDAEEKYFGEFRYRGAA